jgi:hypothetical protein
MTDTNELKYVLYARKSSESDEKQAMSIDGQLMEMKEKAKREDKYIEEIVNILKTFQIYDKRLRSV